MLKNKSRVYHSILEFEKAFFPKSFQKRVTQQPADAEAIGVAMAKESLEKVRRRLERR